MATSNTATVGEYGAPELISDRDFSLFQQLIYSRAGIYLPPVKKTLLTMRLGKRMRQIGLKKFRDYYRRVVDDSSGQELVELLNAITTNETSFFREAGQFDYLSSVIYPHWKQKADRGDRSKHIKIWSAACSSGEEPYSISMSLLENFPAESGWTIDILASDISTKVLDVAKQGIWPLKRAENIPENLLKKYMLKGAGSQEGKMKAGDEVRKPVTFERINLYDESYPVQAGLDAIFCRNVLIYFDIESRKKVVDRLLEHLKPDGFLFLGHAESLNGIKANVRSLAPAIYEKKDLVGLR